MNGRATKKTAGDIDDASVVSAAMSDISSLVESFTNQLMALMESQTLDRARAAVESALGAGRPGRPAKVLPLVLGRKSRKKAPLQLCPVPGCKNPAAPVFGMVCADHKNVAKAKIKKYREARKVKKLGIKPAKAAKRVKATKRRTRKAASKPTAAARPPVAAAA